MSVNAPETTDQRPEAEVPDPSQPTEPKPRGFVIREIQYAWPYPFKLTDPLLIAQLCEVDFDDFETQALGLLEEDLEPIDDATMLVGLVACAVAHAHPSWPRHSVIAFVQSIDAGEIDMYGVDPAPEAAGSPPAEAPTTEPTTTGIIPEPATSESLETQD